MLLSFRLHKKKIGMWGDVEIGRKALLRSGFEG